jgi:threonine dehydratase
MNLVSLHDVKDAAQRIKGVARRTPLVPCDPLPEMPGLRVLVKAENLQATGSFKVRGAANALLARRGRQQVIRYVVTFSAGNHGAAVAYVGAQLGITVTVCMPPGAVRTKVDAVRRYGADIVFADDLVGTAESLALERGCPVLHPFDDLDVIAGQGTVGLEILEDIPRPDAVIVPVGGGGLISGLGSVLAARSGDTRIIGVEPVGARALGHALRIGGPATLPVRAQSVADGLTAPSVGPITYAHARRFVHQVVEVSEEDILTAWTELVSGCRLFVEPSAATTLAALRSGQVELAENATVVLIASGGNAAPDALAACSAATANHP